MRYHNYIKLYLFIALIFITSISYAAENKDPLASWNNGTIKQAIIQFVQDVTDRSSKDYVPPADRIATFDNDGTLWVEQPIYTQALFMFDRVKELAVTHPELTHQEPFQSIIGNHYNNLTDKDLIKIYGLTSTGMSVDDYHAIVAQWISTSIDPRFKHHYTELVYEPMLEVIHYLQANHFDVYIVSGGGQEFMRVFAQNVFNIPPENVIGSTGATQYQYNNGNPSLIKQPNILFINNNGGKPEAINLFFGKKPIIAFGNSDGDRQMLEWTQSGKGKRLMLLVHHDDATREYAYDMNSKIGTFSQSLFDEANQNHWKIISMKNDWKVIFPFEMKQ